MSELEKIRMELYKEVYLQWSDAGKQNYNANIAQLKAERAIEAFDLKFTDKKNNNE